MSKPRITVAKGDGIGPEIMDATLRIMEAAGAELDYDFIDIGEDDDRAFVTETLGDGAADAARCAGDDAGLVVQSWHMSLEL